MKSKLGIGDEQYDEDRGVHHPDSVASDEILVKISSGAGAVTAKSEAEPQMTARRQIRMGRRIYLEQDSVFKWDSHSCYSMGLAELRELLECVKAAIEYEAKYAKSPVIEERTGE